MNKYIAFLLMFFHMVCSAQIPENKSEEQFSIFNFECNDSDEALPGEESMEDDGNNGKIVLTLDHEIIQIKHNDQLMVNTRLSNAIKVSSSSLFYDDLEHNISYEFQLGYDSPYFTFLDVNGVTSILACDKQFPEHEVISLMTYLHSHL